MTADARAASASPPPLEERLRARARALRPADASVASTTTSETDAALVAWLWGDAETHERALLARALDVDDALARARASGAPARRRDRFVEWCERQGIAVSHTGARARARARGGGAGRDGRQTSERGDDGTRDEGRDRSRRGT